MLRGRLPLLGPGRRRNKGRRPPRAEDLVRGLPVVIQRPVVGRIFIWGVEDGFFKEILGHGVVLFRVASAGAGPAVLFLELERNATRM